jgi:hypothetical protein
MRVSQLIKNIFKNDKREIQKVKSQNLKLKVKNLEQEVEEQTELEIINARLTKLEADLEKATTGYRQMLISNNPDILPELIGGESIEALDRSLTTGRELTEKVKKQLEKQMAAERIPGGAPARTPPDTSNLSSHEKIVYGLGTNNQ